MSVLWTTTVVVRAVGCADQAAEGEGDAGTEDRGDGSNGEDRGAHGITVAVPFGRPDRWRAAFPRGNTVVATVFTWKRPPQADRGAGGRRTAPSAGNSSVKTVAPGLLVTVTVPPIRPASSRAIASPSPLPDAWPPSTR